MSNLISCNNTCYQIKGPCYVTKSVPFWKKIQEDIQEVGAGLLICSVISDSVTHKGRRGQGGRSPPMKRKKGGGKSDERTVTEVRGRGESII